MYYNEATHERPARCMLCGHLVRHTLIICASVLCALPLVAVALLALWHRLPPRVLELCVRYRRALRPETKLKQVWGIYAILTRVESVYRVPLTAEVRAVLMSVSFAVNLGFGSSEALLTCFGLTGYLARLIFWSLLPLGLGLVVLAGSAVNLLWTRRYSAHALFKTALPVLLRAIFVLYPLVSSNAFEAFSCYPALDDGREFLVADTSIECWSPSYYRGVWVVSWLAISVYAFGLLALNGLLLLLARNAIISGRPSPLSTAIAFLHREF